MRPAHLALIFLAIVTACAMASLGALGLAFAVNELQQTNSASSAIQSHVFAPKGWTEGVQPRSDIRRFISPKQDQELIVIAMGGGTPNGTMYSYGECTEKLVEFGTGFVNGFLKVKRSKLNSNQYELLKAKPPFQCQLLVGKQALNLNLEVEMGAMPCKNIGFQLIYALENPSGSSVVLEEVMKCESN
jgi:hypothetical protein